MKQHHYQVLISYKGSNYFGWQDLGVGDEKATVQFEILQVLRKISKYAECVVAGASRTDAGVHALGQVAKLTTPVQIEPGKLLLGMNSLLPDDIRVRECESCLADFNPNRHCVSKMYRYYFSIDEISTPTLTDIVAQVPLLVCDRDDAHRKLQRIRSACKSFIGEHDFASFASLDANAKSTVRRVFKLDLVKSNITEFGNEIYYFEIEGNGFLRHMIRYILGTLFEVGRGNIDSAAIENALGSHHQEKLSAKAKSRGLHLIKINY